MNKKTLLLCSILTLSLMGSALNPISCFKNIFIPKGGGGQTGGSFITGQESDGAPTEAVNKNILTATVESEGSSVVISTKAVLSNNNLQMKAHDNTNKGIQWKLSTIYEGIEINLGGGNNNFMLFIDSTTSPPTTYKTFTDTTVYTTTLNGESGILTIMKCYGDVVSGGFSFTAKSGTKIVTASGSFNIPK
jgi:hypothetical protein